MREYCWILMKEIRQQLTWNSSNEGSISTCSVSKQIFSVEIFHRKWLKHFVRRKYCRKLNWISEEQNFHEKIWEKFSVILYSQQFFHLKFIMDVVGLHENMTGLSSLYEKCYIIIPQSTRAKNPSDCQRYAVRL